MQSGSAFRCFFLLDPTSGLIVGSRQTVQREGLAAINADLADDQSLEIVHFEVPADFEPKNRHLA